MWPAGKLDLLSKWCWLSSSVLQVTRGLQKSLVAQRCLLLLVLLATCMLIGDGCLTPSISVVSSISGLQQISSIGEGACLSPFFIFGLGCTRKVRSHLCWAYCVMDLRTNKVHCPKLDACDEAQHGR